MTRAEQLDAAVAAFRQALEEDLRPSLVVEQVDGDFYLGIGGRDRNGLLHDEIDRAIEIANRHGGRLWVQTDSEVPVSIVWPLLDPPGPVGQEGATKAERRKAGVS